MAGAAEAFWIASGQQQELNVTGVDNHLIALRLLLTVKETV